ncbi:MAG: PIN domain-containing protein [Roseiflexaceae bacterium]
MTTPPKPRVFMDSDVLFAGAASPTEHGASLVVLRMAEITLIDGVVSEQVIIEVERNLAGYLSSALPTFRLLVSRCVRVVAAPTPAELAAYRGLADPKDMPILAAAVQAACPWLVTFNVRHFHPGHPTVTVMRPGEFVQHVRALLAHMSPGETP